MNILSTHFSGKRKRILLIVVIILLILFIPIPLYEQGGRFCSAGPGPSPRQCSQKGWYFGPSVWNLLAYRFAPPQGEGSQTTPTAFPTPTPIDETVYTESSRSANWKTYKGGIFTLDYPPDWKINSTNGESIITSPDYLQGDVPQEATRGAVFSVTPNAFPSYGKTIKSVTGPLYSDCAKKTVIKNFTLDNHKAVMYSIYCPGYNPDTTNIFVEINDSVYLLEYDFQPRTNTKYLDTINQILSTFKFLDQQSGTEKDCKNILSAPINPNAGITQEQSYCQGDACLSAKTKNACESVDILTRKNGKTLLGKDGNPDCQWISTVETMYFCTLKNSTTPTPTTNPNQAICTQEAKLCPDGSYVGRTGPKCEFAPCPNSVERSQQLTP